MHIQNINLENLVIQAKKGIDIQEAGNINIKNVTVISKDTNPVAYVLNSDNVVIDKLKYSDGAALLLQVQGERSGSVKITNTDAGKAKEKMKVGFGADEKKVSIN